MSTLLRPGTLRNWWLAALAAFLAVNAVTLAVGWGQPTRFSSTATLIFAVSGGDSATDLNQASTYLQREMTSYARVATSPRVLEPVVSSLRLEGTPADLARSVTAVNPTNTVLMDITASRSDPTEAAAVANGVATNLIQVAESMAPSASGRPLLRVTVLAPAQPPAGDAGMARPATIGLAVILGLAAAALVLVGASRWDRRVWSSANLNHELCGTILSRSRAGRPGENPTEAAVSDAADDIVTTFGKRDRAWITLTTPRRATGIDRIAPMLGGAVSELAGRCAVLDLSTASSPHAREALTARDGALESGHLPPDVHVSAFSHGAAVELDRDPEQVLRHAGIVLVQTPDLASSGIATATSRETEGALLVVPLGVRERDVYSAVERLAKPGRDDHAAAVPVLLADMR